MKNIVIFSNPFGSGPAGKAISIAQYITDHSNPKEVTVFMCGSEQLRSIVGNRFPFIEVNERDEIEILKALDSIDGSKYIISSQNRFPIRAARARNIPCAFLDGLAWFWKTIPEEHFIADIIFWLNYPNIADKIPALHKEKIKIVHGITEEITVPQEIKRNNDILLYLGGCKNPLTQLPTNYLDLFAALIDFVTDRGTEIHVSTDTESQEYLKKYPVTFSRIHRFEHEQFISKLLHVKKFITNGGQTATMEALSTQTPISFFLPGNLSQMALINNINVSEKQPCLEWHNYVEIPKDIFDCNEKDAIMFFDQRSKELLKNKEALDRLCNDFLHLLNNDQETKPSVFLKNLGSTGTQDIYAILKNAWGI